MDRKGMDIKMSSKRNIEEQFNLVAGEYDVNRRKFIPCFDDYYVNTTKMVVSNMEAPKRVLDLGAGTGLLSYYWFQECPDAEYVLVDIADEMLKVACKRFANISNVSYQSTDYTKCLPKGAFDLIMSALSIHHLENKQKAELFAQIYDKLPAGGIFINYDQFCAEESRINDWFDSYWESQLYKSDLTEKDIELWKERRKLDKECSVEKEIEMLYKCNFKEVKCIYSYHKFSVILAIK